MSPETNMQPQKTELRHKKLLFILFTIGLVSLLSAGFLWLQSRNNTEQSQAATQVGLRYIKCSGKNFIVERGVRKKREITPVGMSALKLSSGQFRAGDSGCRYPSYSVKLSDLVRSRNTKKVFLLDRKMAREVQNQSMADAWKIGNIQSIRAPQFYGNNLKLVADTRYPMRRIAVSDSFGYKSGTGTYANVYLVDGGWRHRAGGYSLTPNKGIISTSAKNVFLSTTKPTVAWGTYSSAVLSRRLKATGASSLTIIKVNNKAYVFDDGKVRQLQEAELSRWRSSRYPNASEVLATSGFTYSSGWKSTGNLSAKVLELWKIDTSVGKFFRGRNALNGNTMYFRLTNGGDFHYTENVNTARSWGASTSVFVGGMFGWVGITNPTKYN